MAFAPFTIGANVHLTGRSPVDVYVGPLVGYVIYSSFNFNVQTSTSGPIGISVGIADDFAVGAMLGLDVPIGKRGWVFNTNVRYLRTSIDSFDISIGTGEIAIDFDPLIVGLGFGFRL